jgi:predicted hotdog family 3-hydroxylacyl-ACP dehydratase
MVLLDRVVSAGAESLCAETTIRRDSLFCANDGVGGWVGIEYMAQAIGAYAGYQAYLRGEPVKIGFVLGTRRYECRCSVFPIGSVLKVTVQRLLQNDNGIASFECRIDDNNGELANANLTVYEVGEADLGKDKT